MGTTDAAALTYIQSVSHGRGNIPSDEGVQTYLQTFTRMPTPVHYTLADLIKDLNNYDPIASSRKQKHKRSLLSGIPAEHEPTLKAYWRSLRESLQTIREEASLQAECGKHSMTSFCGHGSPRRELFADAVANIDEARKLLAHARAQRIRCLAIYKFGRMSVQWTKNTAMQHVDRIRWSESSADETYRSQKTWYESMYNAHLQLFNTDWGQGKLTYIAGICISKTRRENAIEDYLLSLLRKISRQFPPNVQLRMKLQWPNVLPAGTRNELGHPSGSWFIWEP